MVVRLAIAAVIVVLVLAVTVVGWGYWHASSHAVLQVSLYDVALKTDRQLYGSVLTADLVFRDAAGRVLASGRADKPWGTVSVVHPEAGDCRREEREGGTAWRTCFDTQSRWLITWVRQVRSARVSLDTCTIDHVPVAPDESRDAWWLWWVPVPHIDNSTYTHFQLSLWIDSANCRAAQTERQGKAMNRRDFVMSTFACAVGLSSGSRLAAQAKTIERDLAALADGKGLNVFNRKVSSFSDGARKGLRFTENPGDGVAYLQGIEFTNGTVEVDIKGKDVQQQSFVGVAFHGVDATTYDAIYFRPFNFRAEDPARRVRAVQYVSHPANTWEKLRAEQPGKYEQAVNPVPDPNGWFHARVVVASPQVSVFVGDATKPSLVVTQLSNRKKGLIGLWVGNNSSGDFANLKIAPA